MADTVMICLLRKLLNWLDDLFIMQHSVMELVVELQAVLTLSLSLSLPCGIHTNVCSCVYGLNMYFLLVYYVGPNGWKKLSGDDVGELHYKYYPVMPSTVEQEMVEVAGA